LAGQDWPIDEIIVFDNGSTDGSPDIVKEIAQHAPVPIRLVDGGPDGFLCSAYNRGAALSRTDILVLCHSDGMVPSSGELRKLIMPLVENPAAGAAYPRLLMPREVWNKFPFWQKFLFVRAVDSTAHSRCAIFDAVRKDVYLKAGGFDEKRFTATCGYGGEDNDAQLRFSRLGAQLMTEAKVVHLHNLTPHYGFRHYLAFRALLARTYGKQLIWQRGIAALSDCLFFVRPALSFLPVLAASLFFLGQGAGWLTLAMAFGVQLLFAFMNSRKMFVSKVTLSDMRILWVLPVTVFMIYYETFWFFHGLLAGNGERKGLA
jgi:glycosyltransferase involved in cell wall biosynthesis